MKNAISKILEINGIVKSLNPSLREHASDVLIRMAFGDLAQDTEKTGSLKKGRTRKFELAHANAIIKRPAFFNGHEHDRLKDNVHLIVAWLYSRFGVFPIETKLLRQTAERIGLQVPNRPDNTMRQAKCKGQYLYQHVGKGWQLTALGERYVQHQYEVKLGKSIFNEETLFDELMEDKAVTDDAEAKDLK
jgi:hypothetical protein